MICLPLGFLDATIHFRFLSSASTKEYALASPIIVAPRAGFARILRDALSDTATVRDAVKSIDEQLALQCDETRES